MTRTENLVPLVDRPADAVLFAGSDGLVTRADFLRDVAGCAARLPDASHFVMCCQSRYWFAVAFAAAVWQGRISLLTGDHSARALADLARRYPTLHALCDGPETAETLPRTRIDLPAGAGEAPEPPLVPAGRIAAVVFTSGSSGEPVAMPKCFGELAFRSAAAGERFGFSEAEPATIIGTVPPHHMYGFETTILLPLHAAASSWCAPVFYPADLAAALGGAPGRQILVTTPLHLRSLIETPLPAPPALVISATAPLDPDLATRAERHWQTRVMEIFGATEVGSIASRRTTEGADWSVYPGLRLTGEDQPLVTAPGARPRHFADVIELLDGGTRFRLIGRSGDIVKLAGLRASLAGLTRALNAIDGVEDGLFVAPDDLETRPAARLFAVVVAPALSREQVLQQLRERIDPVFLPRPLLQVKHLPRNALGKLPREALVALVGRSRRRDKAKETGLHEIAQQDIYTP